MSRPRISFILPCFKKAVWFERAIPHNMLFLHEDCELVIVLDEPSEERWYLRFIRVNELRNSTRIRLLVNDNDHPWRPPCTAINAGVREAQGDYVAITSPETVIWTPDGYLGRVADMRKAHGGLLWNVSGIQPWMGPDDIFSRIQHMEVTQPPSQPGYGFLLIPTWTYGNDDDELRQRLMRFGIPIVLDPRIRVFHMWHDGDHRLTQEHRQPVNRTVCLDHQPDWGMREKFRVAYDWSKK